jgi:glycosyltransferase involved in cell wall biosynthesis
MINEPLVSVVIPFLNAEAFLEEAIGSVLTQTYRRCELLLVDDGSDDGSPEIARAYADRHADQIRYLHHPLRQNRGTSASRNLGIREASGSHIAFLDADDVWLPRKLERQLTIMGAHREAAMVYGKTEYWYSWTGKPSDARRDRVQDHWMEGDVLVQPPALLTSYLTRRAAVPAVCSLLVRRDAVMEVGGFEEAFRGLYEDQVFYAKICLEYPVYVSDVCLERYRQHPDSTCSVSSASELEEAARHYLDWLRRYMENRMISDDELQIALNRQIWLGKKPRVGASRRLRPYVRRAKKWWLKIEEGILPTPLRRRLWT